MNLIKTVLKLSVLTLVLSLGWLANAQVSRAGVDCSTCTVVGKPVLCCDAKNNCTPC